MFLAEDTINRFLNIYITTHVKNVRHMRSVCVTQGLTLSIARLPGAGKA